MTTYEILKTIHVSCVIISGVLFSYRFVMLNLYPDRTLAKPLKVLPHVNDTVLLTAAIGMLIVVKINPLETPWLLAKIVALLVYVVLGAICLRAKPGSPRQMMFFVAAAATFAYIVWIALSKQTPIL